ncbi:MAG TPA: hypothetical protein PKH24_14675 [Sedimentisphaerales bacterium]|jgi:hypothetical protein|nr:hypothetical protein [Sedimentisphaerales bacterium]HNU30608.1 hypothetical protein [Sedimentisphaerales bacterium]
MTSDWGQAQSDDPTQADLSRMADELAMSLDGASSVEAPAPTCIARYGEVARQLSGGTGTPA